MRRLRLETVRKRFFSVVVEVDELALGTLPHAHADGTDFELTESGIRLTLRILTLEDERLHWMKCNEVTLTER